MHYPTLSLERPTVPSFRPVEPSAPIEEKTFTRWQKLVLAVTVVAAIVLMTTLVAVHFSQKSYKSSNSTRINSTEGPVSTVTAGPTATEIVSTSDSQGTTVAITSTAPSKLTTVEVVGANINDEFLASIGHHFKITSIEGGESEDQLIIVLQEMFSSMNRKVDPCDDFYEYACGSFRKVNPITKPGKEVNYWTLHLDMLQYSSFTSQIGEMQETKPLKYLKRIWNSCVKDESSTSEQMEKMSSYFKELDQLNSWQDKFAKLTKDGYNALFTVRRTRSQGRMVHVGPPTFEFDEAYSTEASSPLLDYYTDLIELYKGERDVELAKEIMDFEHSLASNVIEGFVLPDKMIVSELAQQTGIQWQRVLNDFLARADSVGLSEVNVDDVQYVKNFKKTIDGRDVTFWTEYFKVRVMQQTCFFLGKECRAIHFKLTKSKVDKELVEKTCFDKLSPQFEDLVLKVHSQVANVLEDPRTYYSQMTNLLAEKFNELIHNLTWMDSSTKRRAVANLQKVQSSLRLQTPDFVSSEDELSQKYSDAPFINESKRMDAFDYFSNLIKYKKGKEFTVDDQASWPASILSPNLFVVQETKELFVPDSLISGPFVANGLPERIKLGALGSQLAHEMTHAFDNVAAIYEASQGRHLWSEETRVAFRDKMQCLVDAFDETRVDINGQVTDLKINGSFTLNENLADLIGLDVAYRAFLQSKELNHSDREQLASDLRKMTDEQLFFLAYAHVHCANEIKAKRSDRLLETPRRNRVNVVLALNEKFGQAYHCQPGASPLNPSKRCSYY